MAETVKVALVGYGSGGRIFHAPLLASAEGVDFAGVVTTSPQRRAQLPAGLTAYDSLEQVAADGVRAVAISTPAATHADLAKEAIGLGLAVVVDKPFALDAGSAREVVAAAEDAGVPLTVYQNRRWDSDYRTVLRLVEEGTLGDLRRFESRFERWDPAREIGEAGGGTLRDFGSHLVDQALALNGPATRVYATSAPGDDDFFLAIRHEAGIESLLWGSWRQGHPGPRFRVSGTTGTYVVDGVDGMDGQEAALKAGRTPASLGDRWGVEPEHAWGRLYRGHTGAPVRSERGRWDLFYELFAAAVRGEGPLPVNPLDSVRALEVLDAARTSATTGVAVEL